MAANIERFKKDLDRLVNDGRTLDLAMRYTYDRDGFVAQLNSRSKDKEKVDEVLKKLPDFKVGYEAWYSEALALLKQLSPDRVANFVSLYEVSKNRKTLDASTYSMQDCCRGIQASRGSVVIVDAKAAFPLFAQQQAILKAAEGRFDSSLFELRQLVQADLFDSEIDAARELLAKKFFRAAGTIAGVVLEKHLLQVCSDQSVIIQKKHPSLADLNDALKSAGTIDVPVWRHISMLADLRNLCAHNKNVEPTETQIVDLIDGVSKILKTVC